MLVASPQDQSDLRLGSVMQVGCRPASLHADLRTHMCNLWVGYQTCGLGIRYAVWMSEMRVTSGAWGREEGKHARSGTVKIFWHVEAVECGKTLRVFESCIACKIFTVPQFACNLRHVSLLPPTRTPFVTRMSTANPHAGCWSHLVSNLNATCNSQAGLVCSHLHSAPCMSGIQLARGT
jgi:hypothetical protein